MTADAKVGLLLGRVFIVIIAFLINGLPSFLNDVSAESPQTAINDFSGKSVIIAPAHSETIRMIEESVPLRLVRPPREDRFRQADVAKVIGQVPGIRPSIRVSAATPTQRSYIVRYGDNIGVISIKVYGAEKGNKKAAVDGIFAANRGTLSSPDRLVVGQKLIIPDISAAGVAKSEMKVIPAAGIFDKIRDAIRNKVKKPAPTYYVVKAGDRLWDIADEILGDGNRYHEIYELNRDIIADADDLFVGMKLKLPRP
jgi:nucleoid-associated protein YgaU